MPLTREERHERRKQKIADSRKEAKAGLKASEKRLAIASADLDNLRLLHNVLVHFQSRLAGLPDDTPLVFGREIPLTGGVFKRLFPKGTTKATAIARLDPYLRQLTGKITALCEETEKLEQIAGLHSERLSITDQLKTLHKEKIKAEHAKLKLAVKKRALAEKKRESKAKARSKKSIR